MQKIKVFYILLFALSIFAIQLGCAKKIETTKSSSGIEGNSIGGPSAKQGKVEDNEDKKVPGKEETGIIGEEGVSKDAAPGEAARDKVGTDSGEIIPQDDTGSKMTKEEIASKPSDIPDGSGQGEIQSTVRKDEERLPAPDKEIQVAKEEPGQTLEAIRKGREDSGLKDVFFDFNSWVVKQDFMGTLEQNARYLIANPRLMVQIEGHADERGTNEYNLTLGERRAKSTMNFLIDMGIDSKRISIISYGEERPFCGETQESCWSLNRRGHFLVIDR